METLVRRVPNVGAKIFKNLDRQSLDRSKDASKQISEFLHKEKFYWIRIIKNYVRKFQEHEESWREVINKTPITIIKELATAVQQFFEIKYKKQFLR